jgi:endogenous inhibitor of DNA gyrase (YacG/DUF329 family)
MVSTEYGPAWHRYSRWRRLFRAGLAGLLVLVLALAALAPVMGTGAQLFPVLALVSCWLLTFVSAMQVILFHCPRCNERFSMKSLVFRPFSATCVHCGLQKWAAGDLGRRAQEHSERRREEEQSNL